jgi:hypothetical protein
MYLNEQIPMVCLGCLENKYFSLDLIFCVGKFCTEPSGRTKVLEGHIERKQEQKKQILLSVFV